MSIRSGKFVPALLAGAVVGANLATMTDSRAQVLTTSAEAAIQAPQTAADGCLSTPKGATPAGSHWYYRIDRVTKRQCWYLREESDAADKFTRATSPPSAPAPASAPASPSAAAADDPTPAQRTITRKTIADARAEWVSQQPRAEANLPAKVERAAATAAPAPVVPDGPRIAMPNVLAPAPLSSMRWNEAAPTRTSVNPTDIQLAAVTPPAAAQPPQAEEVQQPAVEQVAPFTADAATAKPTASLQKLLMVMAAALALAGLIVSAIVRIGRMRARRAIRRKRRAMWDSAKASKTTRRRAPQAKPQPIFQDEAAPRRTAAAAATPPHPRMPQERITRAPRERPRSPQERPYAPPDRRQAPQDRMPQERVPPERALQERAPQDREQQVAEMLSRLARSAQN
jgi:hypothetical protein